MDAIVISIGTELTAGQAVDTNSAWISSKLNGVGVKVAKHVTVGDHLAVVTDAIRDAIAQADLVVITGGLGPTPDDLTREAIAAAINAPLEEHLEAIDQIQNFFKRLGRSMPESNRRQAMMPAGARVVPNLRGTAPGIALRCGKCTLYALPGVPFEMEAMLESHVLPDLAAASDGACCLSGSVKCFGISEASLGETLADLMGRDRNPVVGTTASDAVLTVRILASGKSRDEAKGLLDKDRLEIRRRLGSAVFGDEAATLQSAVGTLLLEAGKTVATAESCTAGMLAARLTEVPGSSGYFPRGYVTYSNESKVAMLGLEQSLIDEHGAVSAPVAEAMGVRCRDRASVDFALAITGIAGPSGGSEPDKPVGLAFIALAGPAGVEVKRFLLGDYLSRAQIRDRSCQLALNLLRLHLLATDTA